MKFCGLRKIYSFILLATLTALMSVVVACGGGGSTNDSVDKNPLLYSWWKGYNDHAQTLIDNVTLEKWIANGYKTDSGEPIVIIDIDSTFGTDKTIPGSFKGADVGVKDNDFRDDGPVKATQAAVPNASLDVLTGTNMNTILKGIGATPDTVIVLAGKTAMSSATTLNRVWYIMNYWGISEAKLKMLNGKVSEISTAVASLNSSSVKSGSFSVKMLPQLNYSTRVSLIELKKMLDDNSAVIWDSWGSHSTGKGKISKNRFFLANSALIDSSTGKYKTAEETIDTILTAMIDPTNGLNTTEGLGAVFASLSTDAEKKAAALELLKTKKIITHCQVGRAASPAYYYAKEVLSDYLGNQNIGLYDGSWSEFVTYSKYGALQFDTSDKLAKFDTTNYITLTGTSADKVAEIKTYAAQFICRIAPVSGVCGYLVDIDFNYKGNGNEIYDEDYDFLNTRSSSNGNSGGTGGGAGGGC